MVLFFKSRRVAFGDAVGGRNPPPPPWGHKFGVWFLPATLPGAGLWDGPSAPPTQLGDGSAVGPCDVELDLSALPNRDLALPSVRAYSGEQGCTPGGRGLALFFKNFGEILAFLFRCVCVCVLLFFTLIFWFVKKFWSEFSLRANSC